MGRMEQLPDSTPASALGPAGDGRCLVLPAGWLGADGALHHRLVVRELCGADEELLFQRAGLGGAARVTALLARVIAQAEGLDRAPDEAFAAALCIGDRDGLLLRLRQLDLGDAVHQVLRCPHCAGKADIDFLISELPLRGDCAAADGAGGLQGAGLQRQVDLGDCRVLLRLPDGADQAAVETLALANPAAANTRLFARILLDVDGAGPPDEQALRAWPLARRNRLAAWLAQALPGPDLMLDLACPHCQGDISYAFDISSFFLPNA
jgi:hypothetical protein